ncbi:YfhE family protein [Fervidibacillus halotolerans]|uniref:YfhE family protein n=1 Tax=Fervidibacillus halotolerans TaxID=2980027 RepID=A0A9E8RZ86_9BACI|nr:YfhE family protein [Fervidibacillus halotolerans]WAA12929.1 YfhE family protein [Fervidibacillus halotolerans]
MAKKRQERRKKELTKAQEVNYGKEYRKASKGLNEQP